MCKFVFIFKSNYIPNIEFLTSLLQDCVIFVLRLIRNKIRLKKAKTLELSMNLIHFVSGSAVNCSC